MDQAISFLAKLGTVSNKVNKYKVFMLNLENSEKRIL